MTNLTTRILEMAKKKVGEPRNKPTTTSSPTRGSNQDQSGHDVKRDVTDYTISDEHQHKIGTPPHQPEWEKETKSTRKRIVKDVIHGIQKKAYAEETINELISGVGNTRNKPVNMGQSTGGSKEPNAPRNVNQLQHAANQRVIQLDKAAQQEKDQSEKDKTTQQAQRQADAQQRQREAEARQRQADSQKKQTQTQQKQKQIQQSQQQLNKEDTMRFKDFAKLHEAQVGAGRRGRPKKHSTEDDPASEHIMMQMRKVVSTRGQHHVTHVNGEKSKVEPKTAHGILQHHDNLKTPAQKQEYAARIHRSKSSMADAVAGKPEAKQPKVSLAGKITGTQK